jgi:hypothetical protein
MPKCAELTNYSSQYQGYKQNQPSPEPEPSICITLVFPKQELKAFSLFFCLCVCVFYAKVPILKELNVTFSEITHDTKTKSLPIRPGLKSIKNYFQKSRLPINDNHHIVPI